MPQPWVEKHELASSLAAVRRPAAAEALARDRSARHADRSDCLDCPTWEALKLWLRSAEKRPDIRLLRVGVHGSNAAAAHAR